MSLTEQIEKMSEVFKLPTWVGSFGDTSHSYHVCNNQTNTLFADRCTEKEAKAICEAVNSHDALVSELEQAQKRIKELEDIRRRFKEYTDAHQECHCGASFVTTLKQARRKLAIDGRINIDNLITRTDKIISKHSTDTGGE